MHHEDGSDRVGESGVGIGMTIKDDKYGNGLGFANVIPASSPFASSPAPSAPSMLSPIGINSPQLAPCSTSSIYSHLSSVPNTNSLSSLPRHLSNSSYNWSQHRSPDSMHSVFNSSSSSPFSTISHVDRPLSAIAAGRSITNISPAPSALSSRSIMSTSPLMGHAIPPAQSQPQPFEPVIDFEQFDKRSRLSPASPSQTTLFPSHHYRSPSSSSSQYPHQQCNSNSPITSPTLASSTAPKFRPDFFPALPPPMVANFDAMDELMEATLNPTQSNPFNMPSCSQSQFQSFSSSSSSSCSSSNRPLRLHGSTGANLPSAPPSLLARSRFAHLGAASLTSPSPSAIPRRLQSTPRDVEQASFDDLVDSFQSFDTVPVSSSFTHDSSPIQSVRRLGGARQLASSTSVMSNRRLGPNSSNLSTPVMDSPIGFTRTAIGTTESHQNVHQSPMIGSRSLQR